MFQISLQPDCQTDNDNGFFNRLIIVRTQNLIHSWGPKTQGFQHNSQTNLTKILVQSVAHAVR